jgi:hypothetical protein
MSSKIRYVAGEPVKTYESTDILDRIIEGPDAVYVTAQDAQGNTAEAGAFDRQTAEDRAIFKLAEKNSRS